MRAYHSSLYTVGTAIRTDRASVESQSSYAGDRPVPIAGQATSDSVICLPATFVSKVANIRFDFSM